ncbi:MAG: hypothetical protein G01um101413_503 [Parcubacteria group bacterium Gr01-1014_13]|nr:MAG: hypothetical protein G01um101413_503 [Parcubacteria group bacterium Gr01-1014_13]
MKTDNLKVLLVVLGVLVVGLGATSLMYYNKVKELKVNPQKISQEENQKIIDAVGKLVLLPEGEAPTIATVTDPEKLKGQQAFFARAAAGDKVLIYTGALKAIMYRPSENKIIEIAPLVIGNPNASAAPAPAPKTTENE